GSRSHRAESPARVSSVLDSCGRTGYLLPRMLGGTNGSCQFLAQRTHPYTSAKKGGKALLEWLCQGVKGVEADGDHPPFPPTDHPRDRPYFLEQPYDPIPAQPPPGGGHAAQPPLTPQEHMMGQ